MTGWCKDFNVLNTDKFVSTGLMYWGGRWKVALRGNIAPSGDSDSRNCQFQGLGTGGKHHIVFKQYYVLSFVLCSNVQTQNCFKALIPILQNFVNSGRTSWRIRRAWSPWWNVRLCWCHVQCSGGGGVSYTDVRVAGDWKSFVAPLIVFSEHCSLLSCSFSKVAIGCYRIATARDILWQYLEIVFLANWKNLMLWTKR